MGYGKKTHFDAEETKNTFLVTTADNISTYDVEILCFESPNKSTIQLESRVLPDK